MASIASSTYLPISGCFALDNRKLQRALCGTKKTFSALYSSLSSGSAPSSSSVFSRAYNSSKASEMYFRKINPNTTCLYSAASIFFLNLSAAFQSVVSSLPSDCFSKGSSVPFPFFFVIYIFSFLKFNKFQLALKSNNLVRMVNKIAALLQALVRALACVASAMCAMWVGS